MSTSGHQANATQPSIRELVSIRVIVEMGKYGYGYTERKQLLTEKAKHSYVCGFGRGAEAPARYGRMKISVSTHFLAVFAISLMRELLFFY